MHVSRETIPLELVGAGESAEVTEVTGKPTEVRRVAELGIRAGSRLKVLRAGRTCLLLVGGSRLSLRGDLNVQVLVRPIGNAG